MTSILGVLGAIGSALGGQSFTLGDVVFLDTEVPSGLHWGGRQETSVIRRPGGGKTISLGGYFEFPLEWEGVFRGYNALSRATLLAAMVRQGGIHTFTGGGLSRQVVITSFETFYTDNGSVLPYRICCEVVQSSITISNGTKSVLAGLIGDDAASAAGGLSDLVSNVGAYVSSASSVAASYAGQITPLAALFGAGGKLSSLTSSLSGVATNAGALSSLSSQSVFRAAGTQMSSASSDLSSLIDIAGTELASVGSSAGTNLVNDTVGMTAGVIYSGVAAYGAQSQASLSRAIKNVSLSEGTVTLS